MRKEKKENSELPTKGQVQEYLKARYNTPHQWCPEKPDEDQVKLLEEIGLKGLGRITLDLKSSGKQTEMSRFLFVTARQAKR